MQDDSACFDFRLSMPRIGGAERVDRLIQGVGVGVQRPVLGPSGGWRHLGWIAASAAECAANKPRHRLRDIFRWLYGLENISFEDRSRACCSGRTRRGASELSGDFGGFRFCLEACSMLGVLDLKMS